MVVNKPTLADYWDKLKPYLDHKTVIAHNAGFDVGALCATLEHFNIPFPTFDYLCTVKLSQKAYPELPSHKLNNLCDALGILSSSPCLVTLCLCCVRLEYLKITVF